MALKTRASRRSGTVREIGLRLEYQKFNQDGTGMWRTKKTFSLAVPLYGGSANGKASIIQWEKKNQPAR